MRHITWLEERWVKSENYVFPTTTFQTKMQPCNRSPPSPGAPKSPGSAEDLWIFRTGVWLRLQVKSGSWPLTEAQKKADSPLQGWESRCWKVLSPGPPWVSEAKGHALSIVLCSKGRMFCRRDDHVLLKLERGFEMLMSGLNVVRCDQTWAVRAWGGEIFPDCTICDQTVRTRGGSWNKGWHVSKDKRRHVFKSRV